MITPEKLKDLQTHLQTAVEVELSTIPLYLYTYYSINRTPEIKHINDKHRVNQIKTFANKVGGVLMSVAVEEMLHMSLSSNILKALGGEPKIYDKSPAHYPTNLKHHKEGFSIGLSKLTQSQLKKFMDVEKPAPSEKAPQGDNWETLGQFYEYIASLVALTKPEDYSNSTYQLADGKGYYAPNNIDTVYPKDAAKSSVNIEYPNSDDSGGLKRITCKADAIAAINEIAEQGEGFPSDSTHKFDDSAKEEESHWFKYNALHNTFLSLDLSESELSQFIFNFPENPKSKDLPKQYQLIVDLNNAVYSYLLLMTEMSFTLQGTAQSSMFYIGMHKGMIFILDKIIGGMRSLTYKGTDGIEYNIAPSFENYSFGSKTIAKRELVLLAETVSEMNPSLKWDGIVGRIKDLPDVNVINGKVSFA